LIFVPFADLGQIAQQLLMGNKQTPKEIRNKMIKNITAILGVLAAVASLSLADSAPEASAQDTKKMVQNNFVETAQKGIKLSGYVDAGYAYNFTGTGNQSVVDSRFGSDTAQRGDFQLYAVKIALEKAMTSENKAQAGFRADVMIGEDANYFIDRSYPNNFQNAGTGSVGGNGGPTNGDSNSNSLFLEQAYVSIRAPVGNGWDFKVGKFASILGYEVMERPANMNTTFGLLFQQMPLYYTGVLSSYRFDDYVDAKLGVVNGSNSDNNTTLNPNVGDGCALLAALNITAPGGNANWSNNFQYSTQADNNTATGVFDSTTPQNTGGTGVGGSTVVQSGNLIIYNSWGNWAPKFANDKLLLAFQGVLGNSTGSANLNTGFSSAPFGINSTWYGAGAYAKYQFNDWFSLASRGEYLGSNNSGKFGSQGTNNTQSNQSPGDHVTGANWWEYTLTAGFNVIDNLLLRAEYRLDWGSNINANSQSYVNPGGGAGGGPCHYAGAEVVYSF
jgi:hypothetical protein